MPAGRVILAIETSNPSLGRAEVAVARQTVGGVEILAVETLAPTGRHDDALAPALARACASAGVAPVEIGRVAVSVGPGGFSGLRVACATGQMISLAAGAECVAVPTALVAAEPALARHPGASRVLVALASKRESAWLAVVQRAGSAEDRAASARSGGVLDATGLTELLESGRPDAALADERLPEPLREAFERAGVPVEAPTLRAEVAARLGATLAPIAPHRLTPIYPRQPEAVRIWRQQGR